MLSHALQSVLAKAVLEMRGRRHEYLTIEHILFALTYDNQIRIILEGCGADILQIRHDIEAFLTKNMESLDDDISGEILQTLSVERVIARSFQQIQNSGRTSVDVADVLAALFFEEESWAVHVLQKQGLSRLDVLEFISHRLPDALEGEKTSYQKEYTEIPKADSALASFTTDLIEKAKSGDIDPLVGREAELLRMIEILARRRKNNPLLIGEPGTGKTALMEGLAARIAQGKVPDEFKNISMYMLDMASVLAGAKYRGEFEARMKALASELHAKKGSILVIDEIHTIIGSGSAGGNGIDASNLLKPLLSTGELRCIGSTTHEEFRTAFSKDRGLARRFQSVEVNEPSVEECVSILKGVQSKYESHHRVRYAKNAMQAIAELSSRYIQDRMLPDKAIDVLDESGAAMRLKPSFKENSFVSAREIERIVARMANIPPASVSNDEKEMLRHLEENLSKHIFGQPEAVKQVTRAILRSRANFSDSKRPAGSFLFHGPTGVGKTELAKALAAELGTAFIRFDMSEYMEKHAVARLIGSPPGYIGFEQGGLLTEAIRKTPHAVLLLDEIEKAHEDIYNILLQVMDYATLTDNTGKKADFRNVIIIMTTNAGAREMNAASLGFGEHRTTDSAERGKKAVENTFSPEFRNRLDALIPFQELSLENMLSIVNKTINNLFKGLQSKKIHLTLTPEAKEWLANRGFDPKLGARPLERLIRIELEDNLAEAVLFGNLANGGKAKVTIENKESEHLIFTVE